MTCEIRIDGAHNEALRGLAAGPTRVRLLVTSTISKQIAHPKKPEYGDQYETHVAVTSVSVAPEAPLETSAKSDAPRTTPYRRRPPPNPYREKTTRP